MQQAQETHSPSVLILVAASGSHAFAARPRLQSLFSPQPKTVPLVDSAKVEFLDTGSKWLKDQGCLPLLRIRLHHHNLDDLFVGQGIYLWK